ncbi:MAG: YjjG family noncanonical pyrimidine nucleotidase [Bacteroidota bacterium]
MKYHHLLFDADNTLFDFDRSEQHALRGSIEAKGIPFQAHHLHTYHQINKACWTAFEEGRMTQDELRKERFVQFLEAIELKADGEAFGRDYLYRLANTDFLIPGAKALLDRLRGQFRLVMITNGLKEVQRPRLRHTQLGPYFDLIVVSDEIGVSKPHKGFFDYTFQHLGYPEKEQTLVIGDSLSSDIKGGYQYGLNTCWFNPQGKDNASGIQPTYEVNSMSELQTFLSPQ